jgi:hypothetical protein
VTDPAPLTRPASVVHPSWGVNVAVPEPPVQPQPEPQPAGATAVRRGAHAAATDEDEIEPEPTARLGSTAIVTVIAMFCVTLCVAIVSLFGDARGGAVLAGVAIIIGVGMAYLFRERWR